MREGPVMEAGQLFTQHAHLARQLARQALPRMPASVRVGDLIQAGLIGLHEAALRFDAEEGVQFDTFASHRIRGAMLDELRSNDWAGRRDRDRQRKIEAARRALEQRLGRAPREGEVAMEMGLTLPDFHALLARVRGAQIVYLDDLSSDDDSTDQHRLDDSADPADRLQEQRMREALVEAIKSLPEREQRVVSLHYEHGQQQKEIALALGVTPSRVCQILGSAAGRLKALVNACPPRRTPMNVQITPTPPGDKAAPRRVVAPDPATLASVPVPTPTKNHSPPSPWRKVFDALVPGGPARPMTLEQAKALQAWARSHKFKVSRQQKDGLTCLVWRPVNPGTV